VFAIPRKQKHKSVSSYYANIANSKNEKIQCHIELCYIEKLGDFIEIETLTEDNSEENTSMLKEVLVSILNMIDIPISKIEKRYYKEMLKNV
jgi:adenylate cyclase class IV